MSLQVFILNGWATGPKIWESFIEALCRSQGIERTAVHLLSWNEAAAVGDFHRLAVTFIENKLAQSDEDFLIIGWSLGAIVALDILQDLRRKPSMLMILTGSASFCMDSSLLGWSKKEVEAMKAHLVHERASTLKTFYQRIFTRKERETDYLEGLFEGSNSFSKISLLSGLDYLIQTDLQQKLDLVDTSVLWLHGANDCICPIGGAHSAAELLKTCQLQVLNETGHGLFLTRPNECMETLSDYRRLKENVHDR